MGANMVTLDTHTAHIQQNMCIFVMLACFEWFNNDFFVDSWTVGFNDIINLLKCQDKIIVIIAFKLI